jgi:hypothetical protein
MVPGCCWEDAGKGIYPRARAQVTLYGALIGEVGVGATHAQVSEVAARLAAKIAAISLFCPIGMFYPRLADLLEAIRVSRSPTHSVEILGDGWMVCAGHGKKIHHHVSGVAGGYSYRQAALRPGGPILVKVGHVSSDDIRSRVETFGGTLCCSRGRISRAVA